MACTVALLACASLPPVTGGALPGVDPRAHQPVHVVRNAEDARGLDGVIAGELRRRGFEVSSGAEAETPSEARGVVRYEDGWRWDARLSLVFLRVDLRDAETQVLLATAQSYQPDPDAGQSPDAIVADVVRALVSGELRP